MTNATDLQKRLQEDGYPADVAARIVSENPTLLEKDTDSAASEVLNRFTFAGAPDPGYSRAARKRPSAAALAYGADARRQMEIRKRSGLL